MSRLAGEHFRADGRPKRSYPSKGAAEAGLPPGQYAYRCGSCGRWHRATGELPRAGDGWRLEGAA